MPDRKTKEELAIERASIAATRRSVISYARSMGQWDSRKGSMIPSYKIGVSALADMDERLAAIAKALKGHCLICGLPVSDSEAHAHYGCALNV